MSSETTRSQRRAEALAEVGQAFSEAVEDEDALLALVANRVGALMGDGCIVRLLSADGLTLSKAAGGHPDPKMRALFAQVNKPILRETAEGLFAALVDRRETTRMTRADDLRGFPPELATYLRRHRYVNNILTPLVARGRVIGILALIQVRDDDAFEADDEVFLRDIAQRAALSIDNARLLRDANRLAHRLKVTSDAAREFSLATTDLQRLLDLIVRKAAEAVEECAAIRLLAPDGESFDPRALAWHVDPDIRELARRTMSGQQAKEGPTGVVVATGRSIRLDVIEPDQLARNAAPERRYDIELLGIRSLLMVPLSAAGGVIGVLMAARRTPGWPYDDEAQEILQDIAAHAALAIANSRLLADVRASERRFARLAESGLLGVMIADVVGGNVLEANDTLLNILGYSREDFDAGRVAWKEITPPEWKPLTGQLLQQLAERGVTRPTEKEYFRKNGTRVPVLLGGAMLENGQCITFVADLTDRKLAEQALRVTEDQLRHAQKMEAVGRLAGGVAHDFNNILSVILGLTELMSDALTPGDPLRQDLEEIHKSGLRAAELTQQLLLFSRHQAVEPRVIDLNEVLDRTRRMLRRILGEDVHFTVRPSRTARILADVGQIEQVLMNLVVNARDAMPRGGKLTIEVADVTFDEQYTREHLGTKPGPHVMLAVTDTGVGMDRETQAHIFEPFFTTKAVGTGTGLGLSTVFGIVRQAGGTIWVYSEPGKGTTFKLYFPRADGAVEEVRPSLGGTELRGTESILLVEDEVQVRVVARSILQRFGYAVVEARSVGEALLLCEREKDKFDLLISDVVMPEMGGPELARRLVEMAPRLKVLCMSGYTDDAVVRHGLMESGIAFLQKPLTAEKLAKKVREVLDGK